MNFVNRNLHAAPASDERVGADGGAGAAVDRTEPASSPHTRAAYGGALRRLTVWLDGRPLDDRNLAAYLDSLREAGRARATAAIVVAAVRRAARHAGGRQPDGELTRQAMERFRRAAAATGSSGRRSAARGLTADECDRVLAACCRPRRSGRGLERDEAAVRRGLVDGVIVALVFHGALRRSEVAALRWVDVDLYAGDDIVVVRVPLPKTNPAEDGGDVRQLIGSCAVALRRLHAAAGPAPADSVIGLGVHQINRRFAAACAAAGLEGRRTLHSGRVGLAVELAARGASTRDLQRAGGWKDAGTVARYTARVSSGDGPVSRFMRRPVGGKPDN